tara:strand:+ start:13577 stop:15826 length:2250 start_codon:yes stop_codon:yes gene_type:complete
MIIEKNFESYIVSDKTILKDILLKIDINKSKIVFVIDSSKRVIGSISDGDIRRSIIAQSKINFLSKASEICNPVFKFARHDDSTEKIKIKVNGKVDILPILDGKSKIIAVARKRPENFRIQNFTIGKKFPTFIIAEIGNNHNGDINLAKKLIDLAKDAGADCVKFQMRNMNSLYRKNSKSQSEDEDLGSQYVLSLLEKFQLSNSDLFRAFDYARKKKILPLCTAWDIESIENLETYGMPAYKVASADFVNHDLLLKLSETRKPLICSTGMTTESEIIKSVNYLQDLGCHYALLHCNSTYPAAFKDINLKYLSRLADLGKCVVGYSGHERGYNIPIASVGLGARIIEKHFTINKEMEGNDHVVSLLPEEFKEMVNGIREVELSFGNGNTKTLSQGEIINREVLGKSLVINCDLRKGKVIESGMVDVRSPGTGIEPYRKKEIIGKIATRNFKKNDFFFQSDIDTNLAIEPHKYKFNRPWGIPVRYHDIENLVNKVYPDLVEFHLSNNDLELNTKNYLLKDYKMDLIVHAPELFGNDHILDLSSDDEVYRKISIQYLQKTIDVTRNIGKFFPNSKKKIPLVVNVGGATLNKPVSENSKKKMYNVVADSLLELDRNGVEIIPQTMPPLPWHFGGQRFHNLFMDPKDIIEFCKKHKYRICLDISHAKLSCNYNDWDFEKYIKKVAPFTAHLHISDSYGSDGEGVQVGEGEIDFSSMFNCLDKYCPKISFIPEIWQGHKNFGSGFWYALNKLENL